MAAWRGPRRRTLWRCDQRLSFRRSASTADLTRLAVGFFLSHKRKRVSRRAGTYELEKKHLKGVKVKQHGQVLVKVFDWTCACIYLWIVGMFPSCLVRTRPHLSVSGLRESATPTLISPERLIRRGQTIWRKQRCNGGWAKSLGQMFPNVISSGRQADQKREPRQLVHSLLLHQMGPTSQPKHVGTPSRRSVCLKLRR